MLLELEEVGFLLSIIFTGHENKTKLAGMITIINDFVLWPG